MRSQTPPARSPPDPTRRLALVAPARRHLAPSHPPTADTRPPQTRAPTSQATPVRAPTKTPISANAIDKLAPMGFRRGRGEACPAAQEARCRAPAKLGNTHQRTKARIEARSILL